VRAIHLARTARGTYELRAPELDDHGSLPVDDLVVVRGVADRINAARAAGAAPGSPTVTGGELAALGTLHAILHHVIARAERTAGPGLLRTAAREAERAVGAVAVGEVRTGLAATFGTGPRDDPGHGRRPPRTAARARPRDLAVDELLLLATTNQNPAVAGYRDLVDDRELRETTPYDAVVAAVEEALAGGAGGEMGALARRAALGRAVSLPDLLREPARAAPTSIAGQLRWIRQHWADLLADAPELFAEIDRAVGAIAEEERALHLRFGGIGTGPAEAPSMAGLDAEPEAFSGDADWMPRVVLLAKSTHVWLEQLAREYGRPVRTLDEIPDEALDRLARWGVTGLWLIGLWQRSEASAQIKRRRGAEDVVASAYAVEDYRIAGDLGGDAALDRLRERAGARGIRLAADMVPNHMGIDSRWVVEHPDRFLAVDRPPYPAYRFSGPDISSDGRVEIRIEDHYWDATDAAVVFQRRDRASGETRYIYHGNDGTSFPWNDTAQLDYSRAHVREAVIRTILDVARRFPIIRFDAAMVLAKRHVRRLWFPEPGAGGGIPSRSEHALSAAEFDTAMPAEFWREVVDRVAAEVPDTLLLAEAFWLLEGYFVRALGMHRVYNSAFMHMLRDEDNSGYRKVIRETLGFDPEVLKRYVNFLSNPDEKPVTDQFGTGDKAMLAQTVMATLPGLPMLAHGQLEGLGERYGHEFRRARTDERPNEGLIARHERELVPLLRERGRYAGVQDFLFYDVAADDGTPIEDVFAYTNGSGETRSLVIAHNRFAHAVGWVQRSVPFATRSGGRRIRRTIADGLGLPADRDAVVAFRDPRSGRSTLRTVGELRDRGFRIDLQAYEARVYSEIRVIPASAAPWHRLAERLGGREVDSLEAALRDLELLPVHEPLRDVVGSPALGAILGAVGSRAEAATERARPTGRRVPRATVSPELAAAQDELSALLSRFLAAVADATAAPGSPDDAARAAVGRLASLAMLPLRAIPAPGRLRDPWTRTVVGLALAVGSIGGVPAARQRFDLLALAGPVEEGLRATGQDPEAARAAASAIRVLLGLAPIVAEASSGSDVGAWLADPATARFLGRHAWNGAEWISAERWDLLVDLAAISAIAIGGVDPAAIRRRRRALLAAGRRAGYRVDRLGQVAGQAVAGRASSPRAGRPARTGARPGAAGAR
jgi:glycosidase